jgi:hypothetical protein
MSCEGVDLSFESIKTQDTYSEEEDFVHSSDDDFIISDDEINDDAINKELQNIITNLRKSHLINHESETISIENHIDNKIKNIIPHDQQPIINKDN